MMAFDMAGLREAIETFEIEIAARQKAIEGLEAAFAVLNRGNAAAPAPANPKAGARRNARPFSPDDENGGQRKASPQAVTGDAKIEPILHGKQAAAFFELEMAGEMTPSELAAALGNKISDAAARQTMMELRKKGLAEIVRRGVWRAMRPQGTGNPNLGVEKRLAGAATTGVLLPLASVSSPKAAPALKKARDVAAQSGDPKLRWNPASNKMELMTADGQAIDLSDKKKSGFRPIHDGVRGGG